MWIRSAYYYLVCLVTLVTILFAGAGAVRAGLDLALPPAVHAVSLMDAEARFRGDPAAPSVYSREELEAFAQEEALRNARDQRRETIRRLIGELVLALLAVPVYAYHWRIVRREERPSAVGTG